MLDIRVGSVSKPQAIIAGVVLSLQRLHKRTFEFLRLVVVGFAGGLASPLACLGVFVLEVPMPTALIDAIAVVGLSLSTFLNFDHSVAPFILRFLVVLT